jgi:predicted aspartyl protease
MLPSGGKIELTMGTKPVPMVKPFEVQVMTNGVTPKRIEVDFAGIDMNMGLNRPELSARGNGKYAADASLPVCISGHMDWQVTVLVDTGAEQIAIPYRFSSVSH